MENNDMRTRIGARVRELRKENNLTQAKLGAMIGCSRGTIADIELGSRNYNMDLFVRVVQGLGVTFTEFFVGIDGGETMLKGIDRLV